jgi:cohesin complex subunit SA-1/2
MQRRGGKRIRMDEPPPEYENPMTPQVEPDGYGGYSHANLYGTEAYTEHAGTSSSDGMFESPPTPGMRRITRSKARGQTNPPSLAAPSYSPTNAGTGTTTRGRGRGRPPGRKNHVEGSTEDETSLYHYIKNSKVSLTNIVDEWIESYKVGMFLYLSLYQIAGF